MQTGAADKGYSPKKVTGNKTMTVVAGIILMVILILSVLFKDHPDRGNAVLQESVSDIPVNMKSTPESETAVQPQAVVGVWKCERGKVTFTQSGHMMLGKAGVALGGGWLQYEVVDDSTLYLSGGDMPVGINMKYELDGNYLGLELNGEAIVFVKEE